MNPIVFLILLTTFTNNSSIDSFNSQMKVDRDRQFIFDFMNKTELDLLTTMDSLTTDEMFYSTDEDSWNNLQIIHHILTVEKSILKEVKELMKSEKGIDDLSHLDAWLIAKVSDRGTKVVTPLLTPRSDVSWGAMRNQFLENRVEITGFLKQPNLDLRSHYGKSPYGKADCYQMFLVLTAHTMRHHHQILENLKDFNED